MVEPSKRQPSKRKGVSRKSRIKTFRKAAGVMSRPHSMGKKKKR